jgi:membrane fusion protein, multidrug efflux system
MENNNERKNGIKKYIPLFLAILIVFIGAFFWYRQYKLYITSDDAKIDSDNVSVSSKILGRLVRLNFDEGDTVKKGMLLAEIDSADLLAQKAQIHATLDQAIANKIQSEARYSFDQENIKVQEVNFEKAKDDYERAKNQIAGDVISKEQFDHIEKAFETARAMLEANKSQLVVSKAQISSSQASVENAIAQIGVINMQLSNTKLFASMDGIIAKRWLLTGDIVQPGQAVFTLINNKKLWVVVFLEETNVSEIHLGQKAIFTIDAFSGNKFYGKIYSIGTNTASLFSLIPANNASGNFTKVTQRVPVKISIDSVPGTKPDSFKILTGMSVVVKIIKD